MQTESSKPKPNGHCKDMSLGQEQAFLSLPPGIKDLLTKPDEKILHNSIEGRRLTWNEQATWIIEWMIDNWHTPEDIYDVVRTSRLADEEFGDFDDVWLKQEIARRWKEIDELLRGNAPPSPPLDPIFSHDPWEILSGKETVIGADEQPRWAIRGLVEEKSGLLVSGLPHATKSCYWLCAALECVTTKKVWDKFPVSERVRNVVFVETEDGWPLIKRRLRGFCKGLGIYYPPAGFHVVRPGPFDLLREGEQRLTEIIREKNADLLILSTLQGLLSGVDWKEQKDMAPINAISVRLQSLCSIVLLTHSPHKEKRAAGTVTQSANYASLVHFEKRITEGRTITTVTLDSKEASEDSRFDLELVTQPVKHADGTTATQVRRVVYVEKAKGGRPATGDGKKQRALDLRNGGKSIREIAKTLDMSKTTLQRWFKEDE